MASNPSRPSLRAEPKLPGWKESEARTAKQKPKTPSKSSPKRTLDQQRSADIEPVYSSSYDNRDEGCGVGTLVAAAVLMGGLGD